MTDPQVFAFDSLDEAFNHMRRSEALANAGLHDKQRAVTYGSCWVRFYDIPNRVLVFGKVMTPEVFAAEESVAAANSDHPMSPAELDHALLRLRERAERGYLYGRCYSVIEPGGEFGDTHQANLWPISEDLYNAAQDAGWRMDDLVIDAKLELSLAFAQWREHQRHLAATRTANGGAGG